jgi:hypothetical protein
MTSKVDKDNEHFNTSSYLDWYWNNILTEVGHSHKRRRIGFYVGMIKLTRRITQKEKCEVESIADTRKNQIPARQLRIS